MFSNKHNRIAKRIIIFIAPIVPIAILLILNKLQYYIVDDLHMNIYARGGFEKDFTRDAPFVHSILARIWKNLFAFNANVDWMALTYLTLIVICTIILIVVLNKYLKIWQSIILAYLFEITVLGWFTFTVIAYITTLFGIVLIFSSLDKKNNNKFLLIVLGILLADIGYLLRDDAFISVFILALPYVFYLAKEKIKLINNKKTIIIVLSTIIVICSVNVSFGLIVNSDPMINNYKKWIKARSSVVDYNISKYKDNNTLYKDIGFSENDYMGMTYEGGYLADDEVYSYDNLQTIVKNTPITVRYSFNIIRIVFDMAKMKAIWIFAIGWVMCFLLTSKKSIVIIQGLLTVAMIGGLLFIGRCPERVHVPIFIVSLVILLIFTLQHQNKTRKLRKTHFVIGITLVMGVVCFGSCIQLYRTNKSVEEANSKYESLSDFTKNKKDNLFIFNSCVSVARKDKLSIYSRKEKYDNYLSLFSYELYSPMYYYQAERFHLKNKERLMMDIVDNGNIYYVDIENKFTKYIVKYLEEHSKRIINSKLIKKTNEYSIYKMSYGD